MTYTYDQVLEGKRIEELERSASDDPGHHRELALVALSHALAEDAERATALLESIPEQVDADTMGLVLECRSLLAASRGESEERVCEIAQQAVAHRPDSVLALRMLASHAEREADYAKAYDYYRRAYEAFPSGQRAPFDLARVLVKLGRRGDAEGYLSVAPGSLRKTLYRLHIRRKGIYGATLAGVILASLLVVPSYLFAAGLWGAVAVVLFGYSLYHRDTVFLSLAVWLGVAVTLSTALRIALELFA